MAELLAEDLPQEVLDILEIGLQHEQQHQELLVYDVKYILGTNPTFPVYKAMSVTEDVDRKITSQTFTPIKEGIYTIGHQGKGFCFDNELGVHKVYINPCRIMDRLVTNGEYLKFMQSGGYDEFQHWLAEGWDWVNREKVQAPLHWHQVEGVWFQYELTGGLRELNLDQPVCHVSYFEADAYARWSGKRLPTEHEWEVASQTTLLNTVERANLGNNNCFGAISQQVGNSQMLGDVWEWTSSNYTPYPNYQIAEGALGEYNGKFMVNQMVLRGGSCATAANHIRTTYRNFFHPHLRWLFSGIRLAESI
jgi:ergothioneine biosynthesis protein EgtB